MCRKFQCGWSQGLFPDWLSPLNSGVVISIEHDSIGQFLNVVKLHNTEIDPKTLSFLDEWVTKNNTYYIVSENED